MRDPERLATLPRMLRAIWVLVFGCGFAACAGTSGASRVPISRWVDLYPELAVQSGDFETDKGLFRPRRSKEKIEAVDGAVRLYVDGDDDGFAKARDELAQDPVSAYWLTRYLLLFVIKARQPRQIDETDPDRMVGEPVWKRPVREIEALGPAAVPAIVMDLLRDSRGDYRALARELLELVGPEGLPQWRGVFEIEDPKARLRGTEVLAGWQDRSAPVVALLDAMSRDEDWGVRGEAYRGLGRDASHAPRLVEALASEADPYVQRKIIEALADHKSHANASAIVGYMARAYDANDRRGMLAADAALRKMSGKKQRATLETWRSWLTTLDR